MLFYFSHKGHLFKERRSFSQAPGDTYQSADDEFQMDGDSQQPGGGKDIVQIGELGKIIISHEVSEMNNKC
jgi:hypothetical protein